MIAENLRVVMEENYVSSDYYERLLREKVRRESKLTKKQNKILRPHENQLPRKAFSPNLSRKPPPMEKSVKFQPKDKSLESSQKASNLQKRFSSSENDLLKEIDKSLSGTARGFVFRKGNLV